MVNYGQPGKRFAIPKIHSRDALYIDEELDEMESQYQYINSEFLPFEHGINLHGRLCFGMVVNHREPKGADYVYRAVHEARMKGADFKFLFAERWEHAKAMEQLYKKIDVLLEQFIIGWYGLQACEVALMAKPVIVWLNRQDMSEHDRGMWEECPFINTGAWELVDRIIEICNMDRIKLAEIGLRGREYIKKWHDSKKVAEEILA